MCRVDFLPQVSVSILIYADVPMYRDVNQGSEFHKTRILPAEPFTLKLTFMNKLLLAFAIAASFVYHVAAQGNTRLFLDVPNLYVTSPDLKNVGNRVGMGLGFAMNVGTHWSVARLGIGASVTADPQSNDFEKSLITTPFALLEAGAGKYRSNGDRCAKTKRAAYTAMGKAGLRYYFDTRKSEVGVELDDTGYGVDYTVGAELGYFYIRDVFRNFEVVMDANYHIKAKVISATFGFKFFLNLKADRPY